MISSLSRWAGIANDVFNKYILLFILTSLITGFLFADFFSKYADGLSYMLMFMVFVMGTSCTLESLTSIFKAPRGFFLGILILYLVLPLIGYIMGAVFWQDNPSYAVGHFLLAITPVAITSMIWTGFAGGNIALALALVAVATVFSGFSIPSLMSLFMGKVVEFDARSLTMNLVHMIVGPVLVGILLRNRAPVFTVKVSHFLNLATKLMMVAIICVNGAAVRPYLTDFDLSLLKLLLVVFLHMMLNYSVAFGFAFLILGRRSPDLSPVIFTSSMKNTVAGIVIGLKFFGPAVALPVIMCIFMQQMAAGFFFRLLKKFSPDI